MSAKQNYEGPPPWRSIGRHEMLPEASHDDAARFDFLAQLNHHLGSKVLPGIQRVYEREVEPEQRRRTGAGFRNRHEVRRSLGRHPGYRSWSALRRATMEMRQQAGRMLVLRQWGALNQKAQRLNEAGLGESLLLDPAIETPRYLAAVDHHCMPGSYHAELAPGDVAAAANYDAGIFVTTGGLLGRYSDGGGRGVVDWVREHLPDFRPQRILDIGCGLGHNVLPLARAFPEAEIWAVDQAAPLLRYGHARARALGVRNVRFAQGNAESLASLGFEDGRFDWVQSTMVLHETSHRAMPRMMREIHRLLAPGGITLHIEQPQYQEKMDLCEQCLRDWDAFNNNEPYWTRFHEVDLDAVLVEAGFASGALLHGGVFAPAEDAEAAAAREDGAPRSEDFGRSPAWRLVGARKAAA